MWLEVHSLPSEEDTPNGMRIWTVRFIVLDTKAPVVKSWYI